MTIAYRNEEMVNMVNAETGTVDRRIFFEQDIYELELERIFARAWNFMAHDSQIPNPGDFFMTFIGEDRVICLRDNEGTPQVLVNSCLHRGNAICRADEGHATSFMCTYHGWTYDLTGAPGWRTGVQGGLSRRTGPRKLGLNQGSAGRNLQGLHLRQHGPRCSDIGGISRRSRQHVPRPARRTRRHPHCWRHPEVHDSLQLEVRRR